MCRSARAAREIFMVAEQRRGGGNTAREGPHLPRMAAETGRVTTDDPVAPGVELAAA